jgi:hypothetical protein
MYPRRSAVDDFVAAIASGNIKFSTIFKQAIATLFKTTQLESTRIRRFQYESKSDLGSGALVSQVVTMGFVSK